MKRRFSLAFVLTSALLGVIAGIALTTYLYWSSDRVQMQVRDDYITTKSESICMGLDTIEKSPTTEWSGGRREAVYYVYCCEGTESSLLQFVGEGGRIIGACLLQHEREHRIEWLRYEADSMTAFATDCAPAASPTSKE